MYLLFKNQFETPKGTIDRYIKSGALPAGKHYTYAGRLDPLASGILPVLDEATLAEKADILVLPKVYEIEVLFGVSTDSFDILGKVYSLKDSIKWHTLSISEKLAQTKSFEDFKDMLNRFAHFEGDSYKVDKESIHTCIGSYTQTYPFFSSQPVEGLSLFAYTKKFGIEKANIHAPKKEVSLINISYIDSRYIELKDLKQLVQGTVSNISGDFRQDEILKQWNNFFENNNHNQSGFPVMRLQLEVSSGFYMRSFACWLGQLAGTGAIALSICRKSIGPYTESDLIKI